VDREGIIPGNAGTCVFCGVSLVGSPLYTNDGKIAACGPGQTPPNSRPSRGRTAEEDEEKNNRLKRENAEEQEALPQFQSARLATISDRR
jgi:hypothetical protein